MLNIAVENIQKTTDDGLQKPLGRQLINPKDGKGEGVTKHYLSGVITILFSILGCAYGFRGVPFPFPRY